MLLEFDADQRLWQETVRDAVAKQCPASLVRGVAEDGVDPTPLWKTYVDAGWTELTDPQHAVELAIVLEELGRATDPTPFLATLTQFAPLAGDRFDPQRAGTAVYGGVSARRDAEGWVLDGTARHVLDGDRAERLAVVTDAGVFVIDAGRAVARRGPVFDPVLHIAEVSFDGVQVPDADRMHVDPEKARHVALDRYGHHHGRCLPTHPGLGARAREAAPAVRRADRIVSGYSAQGRGHACRDRAGPCVVLLLPH